ncbi:hypothetical protein GUA87_02245 [Sneathiella sp. P13V-1]|uniref:hypothetical protein n=1 Tax=Sneathiella sp. P13V-1 TaxID=2697366 RepID=UPI00187B9BA3|nr:hypothetical protein [Sneathiella sp. P13V-1]MBE7635650.1 hypothetical protein [Sneathiella sp. P13V-1]
MSYGLGLSEKRKAKERRSKFFKFVFYLLLLGAAGAYGYFEGQSEADRKVALADEQRRVLLKENDNLTEKTRAAMDKQSAALAEARAWRDKYEKEIPTGEPLEILNLARTRLEEGLDPVRIKNLITLAQNTENCSLKPTTKRFIVNTPIYQQPGNSISLADGSVTVSGLGASTLNADGKPEAWYDPSKPVAITFTKIGGKTEKVEGVLPISKSLVFGSDEFRFTVQQGNQSFAVISVTRCDFP